MNPEYIKNIAQLWQDVQEGEKKKLDPVDDKANDKKFADRKDKDIDNDGDVDSSDEFLHKRRKAIDDKIDGGKKPAKESCGDDKKMKKESDEDMTPCPDCEGSTDNHDPECPKADTGKKEVEEGKVKDQLIKDSEKMSKKDFIKKYGKEMADDLYEAKEYSNTVTHADHGYGEILQRTDEGIDVMFEHGVEMGMSEATLTFLETVAATTLAKKAKQVAGGGEKHGETQSKGEKDFADKHDKDDPKLAADDSAGHEDATKAGRAVKSQSGTRGNEPRIGDKTIVNPVKGAVTKTTGKE
jgi:hypothetical protein